MVTAGTTITFTFKTEILLKVAFNTNNLFLYKKNVKHDIIVSLTFNLEEVQSSYNKTKWYLAVNISNLTILRMLLTINLIWPDSFEMVWTSLSCSYLYIRLAQWVGLPNNSYKPITNTTWVHARLCKLQKRVHSTRSRKW